jgi:hypothetical protein
MKADGYSLDDKRNPIDVDDIPDVINRFSKLSGEENRKRTEQSFFVPKDEIVQNGYDLSINKYKEVEHDEIEYASPNEILAQIRAIELDICEGLDKLEALFDE